MKKTIIPILFFAIALSVNNCATATDDNQIYAGQLYIDNGAIHIRCGSTPEKAPADLNIDMDSVTIINDRFFKDKNYIYDACFDYHSEICVFNKLENIDRESFEFVNNYYQKDKNYIYRSENWWGWGNPHKIEGSDPASFKLLNERYAVDENTAYYAYLDNYRQIENADIDTLEVLKEDPAYALDKNNMYLHGKILSEQGDEISNLGLYRNLKGKIIVRVEENGEAYYVHPDKPEMHFLSRPLIAFYVMREQGIGITNNDLEKIPVADNYCPAYSPNCDNPSAHNADFSIIQRGKIFLQVEESGEAWYVNPGDSKRYFLGRPTDAFQVMRNLGLGISNVDFNNLGALPMERNLLTSINYYGSELTDNNLRKMTLYVPGASKKYEPCERTYDDRPVEEANSISSLHEKLLAKDISEAISILNENLAKANGASMFPLCSAMHDFTDYTDHQNGVVLITEAGNGYPSYPTGNYSFGYLTASEEEIILFEQTIGNHFDDTGYSDSLADNWTYAVNMMNEYKEEIAESIKSNEFNNKELERQYHNFVSFFR